MADAGKAAQRQLADVLFPVRAARLDEEEGILNVPLHERRLHTETYDFTVSTIYGLLREKKIVVPEFQRRYVWTRNQASRLIESLIIQCPIPVIYLDQEDDGTLKVIDGNQRLMSVRLFLENQFKLRGLRAFPDLNGFSFSQLDSRFQTHIENRTLRCITILKETHAQIKFDVFERLNTGSTQLNAQELRHGLYHGLLMEKLDQWGKYDLWQDLSGVRDDRRMRGAELILRFLALHFNFDRYEKPLASFLNQFAQTNRRAESAASFEAAFRTAVAGVHKLLGRRAFRLIDSDGNPDANLNAAVFDAQMVGFAQTGRTPEQITKEISDQFLVRYRSLQANDDYLRAVSASTSDPPLVRRRISMFKELVQSSIPA